MRTSLRYNNINRLATLTIAFFSLLPISAQSQSEKEMVIAQMNYCINSLTSIINNKSIVVLDHETNQLINNLTMEHVSNLYEVADFRSSLLETTGNLQITEEERAILKRANDMKKDGMIWQSLSNALDPTLLLMPDSRSNQIGFMTLLTGARTTVEYKSSLNEQNTGELQALWELRKKDMTDYIQLRKKALDLEYTLYHKYKLKENDRLTEETAIRFNEICKEVDAQKRLRLLLDNMSTYKILTDYYYHIAMAYIDLRNYAQALPYLNEYINRYQRTPIFRYDEKSGCVALAMLSCNQSLTNIDRINYINMALKNLPDNGAALLQCVIVYLKDLKDPRKAFELLRSGIDNPNMDNKDAVVMFAANMLQEIKKHKDIYSKISNAVFSTKDLSLNSIVAFAAKDKGTNYWNSSINLITINSYCHHPWYGLWIWGQPVLESNFNMVISSDFGLNINDIQVYREYYDGDKLVIKQNAQMYDNALKIDDIYDGVDCFKANPNLIYIFLTPLIEGKVFKVKDNLDYAKIKLGEFRGLSDYTLSEDDLDDIVSFCKENYVKANNTIIIKSSDYENDSDLKDSILLHKPIISNRSLDKKLRNAIFKKGKIYCEFEGDTLMYQPYLINARPRDCIKVILNGPSKTILTYTLNPADGKNANLYSIENGGEIVFADIANVSNDIIKEQTRIAEEAKKASEPSTWENIISWCGSALSLIGNWFSGIWKWIVSLVS